MANEIEDLERHERTKQLFSESDIPLSHVNGIINTMQKDDLRIQLRLVGLDERGVKKVLQRRLKNYYKKQRSFKAKRQSASIHECDYYCIIDFEGTCEENNPDNYVHEIIEFPAILVDGKTLEVVDEFHQYCRPLKKPVLTKFCQNLTGISQETVDAAQPFQSVLKDFNHWLRKHNLGTNHTFVIVTDGPWDLGKFLPEQCTLCGIPVPGYANKWINLRKHYRRYYKLEQGSPVNLAALIEGLGMTFEGRPHSGIDDSRNIAKMFVRMLRDGLEPRINDDAQRRTNLRTI